MRKTWKVANCMLGMSIIFGFTSLKHLSSSCVQIPIRGEWPLNNGRTLLLVMNLDIPMDPQS